MSRVVELPFDHMIWPDRCCSCGSTAVLWRKHTEKAVIGSNQGTPLHRRISLPIPVCDRCAHGRYYWFAGALAIVAAALLVSAWLSAPDNPMGAWCALAVLVAAVLVLKGAMTRPIHILAFDPATRSIRLRLRNDDVAASLLVNPGSSLAAATPGKVGFAFKMALAMSVVLLAARTVQMWAQG